MRTILAFILFFSVFPAVAHNDAYATEYTNACRAMYDSYSLAHDTLGGGHPLTQHLLRTYKRHC
jgi:hypothetical protein